MGDHSVLSPSKAARWIQCPGSVALSRGIEDTGSVYADEGTAAHTVAASWLQGDCLNPSAADAETAAYINVYVNAIRNASEGKTLLVEQHLDIEKWTGEVGGKGTADAVIVDLASETMEVWDLKFGMGHVVDAQDNEQLMLYALGALDLVEFAYGLVQTVKLVICQPRRDHISEHTVTREELIEFGTKARMQGELAQWLLELGSSAAIRENLHPSEKACLWCPVKATCPALQELMQAQVFDEFAVVGSDEVRYTVKDVEREVVPPEVLDLIDQWVSAKREWINERLRTGDPTPGWKLVLGKKGNRKWSDVNAVAKLLKGLRFKDKQIYEKSLLPLTKIEKLVPKDKWPRFTDLIVQADGQPQAVSERDKRPAYTGPSTADDFQQEGFDAFV